MDDFESVLDKSFCYNSFAKSGYMAEGAEMVQGRSIGCHSRKGIKMEVKRNMWMNGGRRKMMMVFKLRD